ncbi:MAG: hypothetical protein A2073_04775 [Deltaproteobacteria bacterium GWC2_42_11]|nr:MAG: hypothetical protein A2073_04775 [Deltaproteobacteria bacterium GWC2_42_11]HBO85263.1 hypothetical protein [Deltaproteobacteria bacterium]
MIKNSELLRKFEDDFIRNSGRLTYDHAIKIYTAMWNQGVRFGVLPSKEPLEEIEVDIRVAKILNTCLKKSSKG